MDGKVNSSKQQNIKHTYTYMSDQNQTPPTPAAELTAQATLVRPTVVVMKDYDGYFERLVNSWIDQKLAMQPLLPFNNQKVVINSGPWRPYVVSFDHDPSSKTINFDFYSALRVGFGTLSASEVAELIQLL